MADRFRFPVRTDVICNEIMHTSTTAPRYLSSGSIETLCVGRTAERTEVAMSQGIRADSAEWWPDHHKDRT